MEGSASCLFVAAQCTITPPQKIPSAKIRCKSSRLDVCGIKTASSLIWLASKGPNYQRGLLLISAGATEGYFDGKSLREVHQGGLVLARQCPGSPGTCNPEETGLPGHPMSWSPTLFSGFGPVGLPPVPCTEKTIERSPIFIRSGGNCCRGDLVGRTIFWIFLSGLQKLQSNRLRSILRFVGGMLNKSRVWSL